MGFLKSINWSAVIGGVIALYAVAAIEALAPDASPSALATKLSSRSAA